MGVSGERTRTSEYTTTYTKTISC